ncbi:hypothetical protein M413DRAFT_440321, partial [Hebeloma cylindrosporum]
VVEALGGRTMDVLRAYIDDRHAAGNRMVGLLGFDRVEGMTEDAVRWFRDAGVDVVHNLCTIQARLA